MAYNNINIPQEIEDKLEALEDPSDRSMVIRVFQHLDAPKNRKQHQYDLYINDDHTNQPIYGFDGGTVFVAFMEEPDDDRKITIVHFSIISRFRRRWQRPYW